jgi:hypothetical protein
MIFLGTYNLDVPTGWPTTGKRLKLKKTKFKIVERF